MSIAHRIYLVVILAIGAILLFYNLDNQYLWQDEAETAALAKNISKFGVPRAYDGKSAVLLLEFPEFSKNYFPGWVWMGQPHLAIYVAYLSFLVLGMTTFAARFPFALMGLASILLTYRLAQKLFTNRAISNISIFLLTFSVPFLLHSRQCRYYPLGIFLTVLSAYFYLDYLAEKRFSELKLLLALFLLLNTSISYFLSVITAIAVHLYFYSRKDILSRRNIIFFAILLLYAIPIVYLFRLQRRWAGSDMHWLLHNIKYYLRSINRYIFPWRTFVLLYVAYAVKNRRLAFSISDSQKKPIAFLSVFIITSLPFLIFANFNSLRYVIHIVPFLFILEAYIFLRLSKWSKLFAIALVLLAAFTNVLSFSMPVRSYFANYIYEITHDYDGPVEGIIKFLKQNAKPTDTVKISYGDNACIFYTDLKVDNLPPFEDGTYPEWIIPRRDWNKEEFYGSDYYKEVKKRYEEITIPYPDIRWENRPDDMGYHKFKTDTQAPRVRIYKRRP